MKKIILGMVLGFFLGQGFIFILQRIWIFPYTVQNHFMDPALTAGTKVYISKFFSAEELKQGDLVFIEHPQNQDQYMIRRVMGLPGDRIEISKRTVFINGREFADKSESAAKKLWNETSPPEYTEFSDNDTMASLTVPENTVFVLGDNRRIALDSRHFGPVHFDRIAGRLSDP